ncbi:CHAT domain-containing protein [Kineosporia succinea]|uniref:CHAT domain-containing protein n=1 Tax=Kineosporia succinea TaxID=84632 RepID=A0ABT9NXG8_9ACTN|nr:CHAT domain-containing protein [Kineosporia succinea]MDP9825016.1 hypothetical protein [Kineosporia succinea]
MTHLQWFWGSEAAPTALGWLARLLPGEDISSVSELAARFSGRDGWPLIGETVTDVLIDRTGGPVRPYDPATSASVVQVLESVREPGGAVDLSRLDDDAVAYCLPALANDPSAQTRAVASLTAAVRNGPGWHAAAIAARIGPYLTRTPSLSGPWSGHVETILQLREAPRTGEEELSRASGPRPSEAPGLLQETLRELVAGMPPAARPGPVPGRQPQRRRPQTAAGDNRRRSRWVDTGFTDPSTGSVVESDRTLRRGELYTFWFEITDRAPRALRDADRTAFPLLHGEEPGMRLTVRISSHPGEFEVPRDQDTGELVIGADQQVIVSRQPDGSAGGGLRLFFRIRTPRVASRNRLRCQLFHEGTLLQSREISVSVTDDDEDALFAQNTQVTYAGPAPDGRHRVAPGSLSIDADGRDRNVERLLLNGFGLHGSADTGAMDLALPATQQAALYQEMRDCLASVLYRKNPTIEDDAGTFHGTFPYAAGTPESWENDLVKLACVGQQNWGTVAGRVVAAYGDDLDGPLPAGFGEEGPIYRFTRLLQQPTVIELANTAEARQSIPAALFYDHPFDVTGKSVQLCATFRAAVDEGQDLAGTACFLGNCPNFSIESVLCPSGFWGFRHLLGVPRSATGSLGRGNPDLSEGVTTIWYRGRPGVVVGVAPEFGLGHPQRVTDLGSGQPPVLKTRRSFIEALKDRRSQPHLIYLFCHGGVISNRAKLRVGPSDEQFLIDGHDFQKLPDWSATRPLVFLNGCQTRAVEPQHTADFAEIFVQQKASGVIGTETVTYEELAAEFADAMLDRFVTRGQTVAEAVRGARLDLLARKNPLGLIYTAFAPPNLRMESEV